MVRRTEASSAFAWERVRVLDSRHWGVRNSEVKTCPGIILLKLCSHAQAECSPGAREIGNCDRFKFLGHLKAPRHEERDECMRSR